MELIEIVKSGIADMLNTRPTVTMAMAELMREHNSAIVLIMNLETSQLGIHLQLPGTGVWKTHFDDKQDN
jgi:hypothetical protein